MPTHEQKIDKLAAVYGLGYTHNPGGGAFIKAGLPDCQVWRQDDGQDFNRLVAWLREHGAERLDDTLDKLEAPTGG
jgi:hypothetical protein